jgi:dihydrofolate reductase
MEEEVEMRKIVAGLFVSLDGVTESPEKWNFPYFNDEMGQEIGSQMAAADTLLLGRRTYEEFAAYWPDKTGDEDPFADYINNTPKFVVSTTLKTVAWRNSTLIEENVAEELSKLKQQSGKNISITGSVTLVRSLLRDGLLDELRLMIHPIVLGTGRRLFEDGSDQLSLNLVDAHPFSTGVLSLTYEPASE